MSYIDAALKRSAEAAFGRALSGYVSGMSGGLPITPKSAKKVVQSIKAAKNGTSTKSTQTKRRGRSRTTGITRRTTTVIKQRRGKRVSHKGKVSKFLAGGIYTNHETSSSTSTADCQYLGHATCPPSKMGKAMWYAILKLLYLKMNIAPADMSTAIPMISNGDTIEVYYKNAVVDTLSVHAWIASATGADLYSDPALYFESAMYGDIPSTNLHKIRFFPAGTSKALPAVEIPLMGARIRFDVQSDFKFQNRSVNETGDEDANDVDHVALQGRMYEGKGTGTTFVTDTLATDPFVANHNGVIEKESDTPLKEPPFGQLFSTVKKSSGVRLGPGEIKHSVLKWSKTIALARIGQFIWNADDGGFDGYLLKNFGLYRFYALEKMILSGDQEIKTAYEHNLRIACRVYPKSVNYTSFVTI